MIDALGIYDARRLAALGYPQGQWPQMVWGAQDGDLDGFHVGLAAATNGWLLSMADAERVTRARNTTFAWLAAPNALQALDWLEQKKGYEWRRTAPTGPSRMVLKEWVATTNLNAISCPGGPTIQLLIPATLQADSATALVTAILDALGARQGALSDAQKA